MPDDCSALEISRPRPRQLARNMRRIITGFASGMALQAALPMASAQEYELVPPAESKAAERGISVRAQIDVLYTPLGGGAPVLVQKAIETRTSAVNLSSQYVFEILNNVALAGVDQALAGGAVTGRVSVVAVCYAYGVTETGAPSLAPMGVFINTTDLSLLPNGNAALRTNLKVIPPAPEQ